MLLEIGSHHNLLDVNYHKVTKPLSYFDALIAKAHCTDMEGETLYFTLWEDDAKGSGHNKINEVNKINQIPLSQTVINGKAEVKFNMAFYTQAAIIANMQVAKGDTNEGKNHEYYVTAEYYGEIAGASNNVNIKNENQNTPFHFLNPQQPTPQKKDPHEPNKRPTPPPRTPKKETYKTPITQKAKTKAPDPQGKIISAEFVDFLGKPYKKMKFGTHIKVKIVSKNMKGKTIKLIIWEDDISNQHVFENDYVLSGDVCYTTLFLTEAMRKNGDDLFEGPEQEYFLEIEYAGQSVNSEVVNVNDKAPEIKTEPSRSMSGVGKKKIEGKKGECFCNKDFEEKDVRKLVKLLKGSETIWEGLGKVATCNISDKSFGTLTTSLNNAFKKYKINTCAQKMHFLAQVCEETGTFALSEEIKGKYGSSQSIYKGRGLLQLTGVKKTDSDILYDKPGPYQDYANYKGDPNIVNNPIVVANNVNYCIDSGAWIWSVNKKMTKDRGSKAIKKWGTETLGKSLNELATYVDKYIELISVLLNGRNKAKGNMPNNYSKRVSNYKTLKAFFFRYDYYHGNNSKPVSVKDIVTYNIYFGGKIEKYIPKEIKDENKKKYRYVYHDKNNKEHQLGVFNYTLTKEMNKGNIAGIHNVELIDVREFKGYSSEGIKLKFLTLNTDSKRYFINPDCYAGLLGAMADMNIDYLGFNGFSNFEAKSTGGSSSHRNGEKGDLRYLSKNKKGEATILQDAHFDVPNQNKFNDTLYNFGWARLEKMYSEHFTYNGQKNYLLNHTKHMMKLGKGGYRHYHHLHLSGFDHSLIKIIKEQ